MDIETTNHYPYEKMSESTAHWDVSRSKAFKKGRNTHNKSDNALWSVSEKVHGANFCFITDGTTITAAKRGDIIKKGDLFFGYHKVLDKYTDSIRQLFDQTRALFPDLVKVSIYGELFGGAYPMLEDVDESPQLAHDMITDSDEVDGPVQTGIFYCPHKEFYAFDIAIHNASGEREYVDFDIALKLFRETKIFHAEPLFIGGFEECLHFNNKFESTIPARLGMPKLKFPNLAEGVVIKPMKTTYVDTPKGKVRAIVKKKIELFAEKMQVQDANIKSLSNLERIKAEGKSLMTVNRLNNVISKHGKGITAKAQRSKLQELFTQDVYESLVESKFEKDIKAVGKESVMSSLNEMAKDFLLKSIK